MAAQFENALPKGTVLKHGSTKYRIEKVLGAGGFGITYLVSSKIKVSGCEVSVYYAMKEYFQTRDCERNHTTHEVIYSKPAKERVEEGKKDFLAEAHRLQKAITHSHIVKVTDVFETNQTAYYVMEFLEGKTMRSYVRDKGACKEDEAIALLFPIACAVGYLHDERIMHLDIKPDNIMIIEKANGSLSPILIDFGLSKHYDKNGQPTSTLRTLATSPGYASAEQYQGIYEFQPTADVYSLAATLVYCLTASDPKEAADIKPGELRQLLEKCVSANVLAAILNGMAHSRYDRTATIRDFLTALCPDQQIDSWDTEIDNNVTDPRFFRKKKKVPFTTRLKSLFNKRKSVEYVSDEPPAAEPSEEDMFRKSKPVSGQGLLSSSMLGFYKGMMTEIYHRDWNRLSATERHKFTPFAINLKFENQRICILAEDVPNANDLSDVKVPNTAMAVLSSPAGILGYERGEYRLPNANEAKLLGDYSQDINYALSQWGVAPLCEYFWVEDANGIHPNIDEPAMGKSISARFIVNYWTIRAVYDRGSNLSMDGIQIFTMSKTDNGEAAALYHRPEIAERIFFNKELQGSLQKAVRKIANGQIVMFPFEDETPISYFWEHLEPRNTLLLESSDKEYVRALGLQYCLRQSKHKYRTFRICHPAVLNAFWRAVVDNRYEEYCQYALYGHLCTYSYENYVCEIVSVEEKPLITGERFYNEGIIKGAVVLNRIINGHLSDPKPLLMDIMEYDVKLVLTRDGRERDVISIVPKHKAIPTKNSDEVPLDLIRNHEIYLQIGKERVPLNSTFFYETELCEGLRDFATFTVEIDADKNMELTVQYGSFQKTISVGEIISSYE